VPHLTGLSRAGWVAALHLVLAPDLVFIGGVVWLGDYLKVIIRAHPSLTIFGDFTFIVSISEFHCYRQKTGRKNQIIIVAASFANHNIPAFVASGLQKKALGVFSSGSPFLKYHSPSRPLPYSSFQNTSFGWSRNESHRKMK